MPKDPFIREKFTKVRPTARKLAAAYFERYPKDRYLTEVEGWRHLQSDKSSSRSSGYANRSTPTIIAADLHCKSGDTGPPQLAASNSETAFGRSACLAATTLRGVGARSDGG
jgi:hypothetical protein